MQSLAATTCRPAPVAYGFSRSAAVRARPRFMRVLKAVENSVEGEVEPYIEMAHADDHEHDQAETYMAAALGTIASIKGAPEPMNKLASVDGEEPAPPEVKGDLGYKADVSDVVGLKSMHDEDEEVVYSKGAEPYLEHGHGVEDHGDQAEPYFGTGSH